MSKSQVADFIKTNDSRIKVRHLEQKVTLKLGDQIVCQSTQSTATELILSSASLFTQDLRCKAPKQYISKKEKKSTCKINLVENHLNFKLLNDIKMQRRKGAETTVERVTVQ